MPQRPPRQRLSSNTLVSTNGAVPGLVGKYPNPDWGKVFRYPTIEIASAAFVLNQPTRRPIEVS
jgi:hypothetical protein